MTEIKRQYLWVIIIILLVGYIFMSLLLIEAFGRFTDKIVDWMTNIIKYIGEKLP